MANQASASDSVITDIDSAATELMRCEQQRVDRTPITDEWAGLDQAAA